MPSTSPLSMTALTALFDDLPDAVLLLREKGLTVLHANQPCCDLLGRTRSMILGRRLPALLPAPLSNLGEILDQALRTGAPVRNVTLQSRDSDGSTVYHLVTLSFTEETRSRERSLVLVLHDVTELNRLRDAALGRGRYGELVGKSRPMRRLFKLIESVSDSQATVLLIGETGTGKELAARTIHKKSSRSQKPFVAVQCSALAPDLVESELFGHVKGAFTGAHKPHAGRFQRADGGTLLLDEVGTLSPAVQAKLLRVLQEQVVEPVGGDRGIPVDVRIIAATNEDLQTAIADGSFREDLYYRLNVVSLAIPPLRKRGKDILLLSDLFIKRFNYLYEEGVAGLSPSAKECLLSYAWPGNVRELENAMEHAFLMAEGALIETAHLPQETRSGGPTQPSSTAQGRNRILEIRDALVETGGNKTAAARLLGMHRSTLWRLMREHRIDPRTGK